MIAESNPDIGLERRWNQGAILLLVVTSLIRLPLLRTMDLVPDEAYYWDWSRHFAAGYYDQGPMIAYVIKITTAIFGTNEFGVRFGVWLATAGALYCLWILARRIYSAKTAFYSLLIFIFTPLTALGSQIATYDPLLVLFWALALLPLERALFADNLTLQKRSWFLTGVVLGSGFLSKHTMMLLPLCLLLFLMLSPERRFWLRRPEPWAAMLISLILYSGVFWWNAHHHWWTFGHLLFLTHHTGGEPFRRLGEYIGSQALLIGPVLFLGCIAAGIQALRRDAEPAHKYLACMGIPIILFFCLLALKTKVQANWAPFAYLSLTPLWVGAVSERPGKRRSSQTLISSAVITGALLTLLIMAPGLRKAIGFRLAPQSDVTNTAYGWRSLAARVQKLRLQMERNGHKVFISGNGYQYVALMAFYLPDHPPTYDLFLHFRLTMYAAYVDQLKSRLGEDSIFINSGKADDADLHRIFTRVQWLPPFPIYRRPLYRKPIEYIYIAKCYGYRLYTGLKWAKGG